MLRLQKFIAQSGLASRRAAEGLIAEGEIKVNGKVVTQMGVQIDPKKDVVEYQGQVLRVIEEHHYFLLNKPAGYLTTRKDTHGRRTVYDLLSCQYHHLVPAGRLDMDTTGLLVLSNDGDFVYRLTHPSFELEKEYMVTCKGEMTEDTFAHLEQGVMIENRKTSPAKVSKIKRLKGQTFFHLTIHEGRKRQVRMMCDKVGHQVIKLKRVRIGPLQIDDLPEGQFRTLSPVELEEIKKYL